MGVDGGKCDFSNPTAQRTCKVLLGLADLVPIKLTRGATYSSGSRAKTPGLPVRAQVAVSLTL